MSLWFRCSMTYCSLTLYYDRAILHFSHWFTLSDSFSGLFGGPYRLEPLHSLKTPTLGFDLPSNLENSGLVLVGALPCGWFARVLCFVDNASEVQPAFFVFLRLPKFLWLQSYQLFFESILRQPCVFALVVRDTHHSGIDINSTVMLVWLPA